MNFNIRRARPSDSEEIVAIFEESYDDYPSKGYRDPSKLRSIIESNRKYSIFVAEIIDGQVEGDTSVVGTGSVIFSESGEVAELAKAAILPDFRGLEDKTENKSAYKLLLDRRLSHARNSDAFVIKTQANSSIHAITQYEFNKRGFIPVGVSKARYREAFKGKGRENIIIMIDSESNFRPFKTNKPTPKVYSTNGLNQFLNYVIDLFGDELEREVISTQNKDDIGTDDKIFYLDIKENEEINKSIKINILVGGGSDSIESIVDKLSYYTKSDNFEHISVSFNANHPSIVKFWNEIDDLGYRIETYEPDGSRKAEVCDIMRFQHTTYPQTESQIIDQVFPLLDRQGLPYTVHSELTEQEDVYNVVF